uniref:voltage-gated hydrogen channel 1-like isoform X1 n=1 Tax=Oncorhynchus gorbuscha TaxID=8017 RepID=UPI001EAE96ED|nr:voltage-gated hydrogen channel 1-like isoform X1 [Oncorhynchus gorbuscha]
MSKYLRHFTTVGDDHTAQWQDEELHEASEELGPATGQMPQGELSFRDSLKMLYSSNKFQIVVVCLVILDAIFVLVELLIELSIIDLEHGHIAPQVFHYLSLALLTFFMVELAGKLFAYQLEFFHHKFEVFDGLVVIVSFILDVVYTASEEAFDASMGLLILLRLWRVARIINGERFLTLFMFIRHQREENGLKQGGTPWTCPINTHFKALSNACPNEHNLYVTQVARSPML